MASEVVLDTEAMDSVRMRMLCRRGDVGGDCDDGVKEEASGEDREVVESAGDAQEDMALEKVGRSCGWIATYRAFMVGGDDERTSDGLYKYEFSRAVGV